MATVGPNGYRSYKCKWRAKRKNQNFTHFRSYLNAQAKSVYWWQTDFILMTFFLERFWQILADHLAHLQVTWGIVQKKWSNFSWNIKEKLLNTLRHSYLWRLIINKRLSWINYKYRNNYILYFNFPGCHALFLWQSSLFGDVTFKPKCGSSLEIWTSVQALFWPLVQKRQDFHRRWIWFC